MVENILIGIIFVAALVFIGRSLYKNYQSDAGCSKGCDCDSPIDKSKFKVLNQK